MKNKKKKIIIIISSIVCVPILIVALILTIRSFVYFPASPTLVIKNYFLWNTPIGSSYDEVYTFLNNCDKCQHIATSEEYGFAINKLSHAVYFADEDLKQNVNHEVYGEKAMKIFLGYGDFPLPHSVSVFFAFDEKGELIKIYVEKANNWP